MSAALSEPVLVADCVNGGGGGAAIGGWMTPDVDCSGSIAVARGNRVGSMGISTSINLLVGDLIKMGNS